MEGMGSHPLTALFIELPWNLKKSTKSKMCVTILPERRRH